MIFTERNTWSVQTLLYISGRRFGFDDKPWLQKLGDNQAQMGQVRYVFPRDSALILGWRGPTLTLHPPHVKYIPHGRSVDIRLISPVGGFDSQMGMGCFSVFSLCMTQLPWAKESCWLGLEPDSHPFRVWFSMTDLTCKVRKVLQWNKAG